MELNTYLPSTSIEYIGCFRQLAALTNAALDYIENKVDWVSSQDKNKSLSRIAASVETISSLRGDTGSYSNSRPDDLVEYQKEMYTTEDYLRGRLIKLGYKSPTPM